MGIKGLAKLLADEAPDCIREVELSSLHGRKVAIDASMSIYQFLIAVRQQQQSGGGASFQLTNDAGETTSHVQGMFNRTIRYYIEGIKPVFVFDGKPPNMKSGELLKRREKRAKAQAALKVAQETGDGDEQTKQEKRLVRAGQKENADCQRLLTLMGVPVVLAPCEAEAQAAHLAKTGQVYATGTEDMDALTFATPVLIRKLSFAGNAKAVVQTMNYDKAIAGLELTSAQFIDLCILLGCDYCDTIRGVGPKTALKLIRQHSDIETILSNIDTKKFAVPDSWIPNAVGDTKNTSSTPTKENKEAMSPSSDREEIDAVECKDIAKDTTRDDKENCANGDNVTVNDGTNNNADKKVDADTDKNVDADTDKNVDADTDKNVDADTDKKTDKKVDVDTDTKEAMKNDKSDEKSIDRDNDDIDPVPAYVRARALFLNHEVIDKVEGLKWKSCDAIALTKYLVDEMGFSAERVASSIQKLQVAQKANSKPQSRMDAFFKAKPISSDQAAAKKKAAGKRKAAAVDAKKKKTVKKRR